MEFFWTVAYLVLAGLAIGQSLVLALQTWEHRRYVRSCMRGLEGHLPTGHVAVLAPCKGLDVALEGNLRALLRQDYHDYEIRFIVESADDPACPLIRRVIAEHPGVAARLVVAGRTTESGQKVHNLRAGTAGLPPQVEYLAFVDSDARPRPEWLRLLVARLFKPGMGAVTGYRWFVPARGSIANRLLYSINCGVMSLLGRSSHYFVWGGSWGIRRDVFDAIGLHEAWKGTLSDDLVASRRLRRAGIAVRFEPACVVASPLDDSMRQMYMFVRRQYLVGRFYVPNWWVFGLCAATLANLAWLSSLIGLGCGLVGGSPPVWLPAAVAWVLYLLSVHRGLVRQSLVGTHFPERRGELRTAGRFDTWAGPVVGLVNWLGMLGSLFGRHITWRGITYRVSPGGQIRVVGREAEAVPSTAQGEEERQPPQVAARKFAGHRKAG